MAQFRPGDSIRVLPTVVDTHHRTPGYVKGKLGRVKALSGTFPDPESRAYGGTGLPERALYLIEFDMRAIWGERYSGPTSDSLLIDIYEQWLEPAHDPACHGGEA